jgi:heme-degrading monooxygenase HmoA
MFVHMSIHRPRPGKEKLLIASMHRFGAAMQGADGFQWAHALQDETSGALIGLAIWESKEQWQAAHPKMSEAVKDDPFEEWEEHPPEVFVLKVV